MLNDQTRYPCETGLSRPDVADTFRSTGAATAGFEAFIDVPQLEGNTHRISLLAVDERGTQTLDVITIDGSDPRPRTTLRPSPGGNLHVDRLTVGSRQLDRDARALVASPEELITIEGWALNDLDRRAGVAAYMLVDDFDAIPVSYGFDRDDVAQAYSSNDARQSGFRAKIDPSPYSSGSHWLRLVVIMDDGCAYSCDDTFAMVLK